MSEVVPVDERTPADSSQAIEAYRSPFVNPPVPHGPPTYEMFSNRTLGKIPLNHIASLLMTGSAYNPQISGKVLQIRQALDEWMRAMEMSYAYRGWAVRVGNERWFDSLQFMIGEGYAHWIDFERIIDLASKVSLGPLSNAADAFWLISTDGRFRNQTDKFFQELVKEVNETYPMQKLLAWNLASTIFLHEVKRAMDTQRLFQASA